MNILSNVCLLMSLIFTICQGQNPVTGGGGGSSGSSGGGVISPGFPSLMLMNTLQLRATGNYSIGYLPMQIVGQFNSSACRRVGMFKFPAIATGLATTMTINVLPMAQLEMCDVGFNLYESDGNQIGNTFISPIRIPPINGGAAATEASIYVNVTSANWLINSGIAYYLTIQTFTWDYAGGRCNMRIPHGLDTSVPSVYGILIQQGPADMPCGATPWTTVSTNYGGFIRMSISGNRLMSTVSVSQTPTPTSMSVVYRSASPTPTPTSMSVVTNSASQTPTPTSMTVVDSSASETPTPTSTGTMTFWTSSSSSSNTATSSPTSTTTSTPTGTTLGSFSGTSSSTTSGSFSGTSTPSSRPFENPQSISTTSQNSAPSVSSSSIIGVAVGVTVVLVFVAACITYKLNENFRNTVEKISGFKDARSPVSSKNVITMNPVNDNTSTYYGQTHV